MAVSHRAGEAERNQTVRRMVADLVLDTSTSGIWLVDAEGRTTFVNRQAAALLGYREDQMIGMMAAEFFDDANKATAARNMSRRQAGITDRHAVKLRRKDGRSIWVMSSGNPIYDRDGNFAGALSVFNDLTGEKETEARLRAQLAALLGRSGPATPTPISFSLKGLLATALVCGTFLGITGLAAAGNLSSALLRRAERAPDSGRR